MHIALHSVTLILQTKSLRPREFYLVPKVKQVTDGRAQVQTQAAWPRSALCCRATTRSTRTAKDLDALNKCKDQGSYPGPLSPSGRHRVWVQLALTLVRKWRRALLVQVAFRRPL